MCLSLSRGGRLCAIARGADPRRRAQPVQLLLLHGVRLLPAASRGRALLLVRRPAAAEPPTAPAVGAQVRRVEVEQVGAHVVEQDPVVAGEHDHPGQVAQERGQLLDGVVVEVVGRLVEQQARRTGRHHRGQGETGALTTRQRPDRAGGVERTESEPLGGLRGATVGVPGLVARRRGPEPRRTPSARPRRSGRPTVARRRRPSDAAACRAPGQDGPDRGAVAERRLLAEHHHVGRHVDRRPRRAHATGGCPTRARRSVDLPEPFSPTRPVRRPGETVRSRSWRTWRVPNQTSRPETRTDGSWRSVGAGMREPFGAGRRTRRAVPRARVWSAEDPHDATILATRPPSSRPIFQRPRRGGILDR